MHSNKKVSQRRDFNLCSHLLSKNNPHGGGILTCVCMLPPSSQKKSSQRQREDFDLCPIISKNNPHRRGILTCACMPPIISTIILPERRIMDRILCIEGYLHVFTFYSGSQTGHVLTDLPIS